MKVSIWAGAGIGGTEKSASSFAAGLALRGHEVDYLSSVGPRILYLRGRGVNIINLPRGTQALAEYLRRNKPDVFHQHVPGNRTENPIYGALREIGKNAPILIETNHFGRFEDPEGDLFVRYRNFVSRTSAVQAFRRAGKKLTNAALDFCGVLSNPLEEQLLPPTQEQIQLFRENLGFSRENVVVIRVGQPGGKWTEWECESFATAIRIMPELRLVLMQPPEAISQRIRRGGFGEGITVLNASSDFAWVQNLYAASDLMLHASSYGESFGYSIAEAMSAGLPVITRSTPWGDNAQIELVEDGVTGFVCGTVAGMANRLIQLCKEPALRRELGEQGRRRIHSLANLENELDVLEAVLRFVTTGIRDPLLDVRRKALVDFAKNYAALEQRATTNATVSKLDSALGRGYAFYRSSRTKLRRQWDSLRLRPGQL